MYMNTLNFKPNSLFMKKLALSLLVLCLSVATVLAQRTVTGTVTDGTSGEPLIGATVLVKGTSVGTSTDIDGRYSINVPSGNDMLVVSYTGYNSQDIALGSSSILNITLGEDVETLGEIVVTGVSQGTSRKKLGFSLTKVDNRDLEAVPGSDASQVLRGKVAGIQISQTQGDEAAAVFFRGSKSLYGNIDPLILVDGIITNQGLGDINAEDINTIETVKGAAATALYGSQAAGGVIQILTKRGSEGKEGLRVTVATEYGVSDIPKDYPISNKHPWKMTAAGDSFDLSAAERVYDVEADGETVNFDNDYPVLYDHVDLLLTNKPFSNNYISVGMTEEKFSLFGSYQRQYRGGVVDLLDPDIRNSVRLNASLRPTERFNMEISTSLVNRTSPEASRNDQGTLFADILVTEPFVNLEERDADGDYSVNPFGFDIQGANIDNPLYQYDNYQFEEKANTVLAGIKLQYDITEALQAEVGGSIAFGDEKFTRIYPKGFKTKAPSAKLNSGQIELGRGDGAYTTSYAQLTYGQGFGDWNLRLTGKALLEKENVEFFKVQGNDLLYDDFNRLFNAQSYDPAQGDQVHFISESNTLDYFGNVILDYDDTYGIDALVRLDGSSLFGTDNRWNTFYRAAAWWRITEQFEINNFSELKLRAAYGTAGVRPGFGYKDKQLGFTGAGGGAANPNLGSAVTSELELGVDGEFFKNYYFDLTVALANSDDFLNRPLLDLFGQPSQWQNLGNIKSSSLELKIGADDLFESDNFAWDWWVTFSKVNSEITDLEGAPAFTDPNNGLFRIETGSPIGTMYGANFLTSTDQLQLNADGTVLELQYGGGHMPGDFVVNNEGYVVLASTIGTSSEAALYFVDEATNTQAQQVIGNSTPDFIMGIGNRLTFMKDLELYFLFDWKQGGDKYNQTKQYLYFNWRHQDQEAFSASGHHPEFSVAANSLYNGNNFASHFVEDATYLKLRELSLSYTLPSSRLGMGKWFDDAKISLIGRNLFTVTNYTGWDPEGAWEQFPYPLYRTISGKLRLRF